MRKIECVILDWAGTAVDFGSMSPVSAFTGAFKRHGIEVTDQQVRAPMGMLKRDHIRTMFAMPEIGEQWKCLHGVEPDQDAVEAVYADFEPALMASLSEHCDLKPGLLDAVHWLKSHGIRIGSTTGFTTAMMQVVQRGARNNGYAPDLVVTADDVGGFGRPWPYMIFRNMQQLQIGAVNRVVKVGDTLSDIEEAKRAGVVAVGVAQGSSEMGLSRTQWEVLDNAQRREATETVRDRFFAAGADAVIDSLADLPALIAQIQKK